jgi:hypothetical protein
MSSIAGDFLRVGWLGAAIEALFSNHLALLDREVAVDEVGADSVGGRFAWMRIRP